MMKSLPSFSTFYFIIIQEERQRDMHLPHSFCKDAITMNVSNSSNNSKKYLSTLIVRNLDMISIITIVWLVFYQPYNLSKQRKKSLNRMFKLLLLKLQQSFLRNNINISFIFSIKIICSLLLWLIHTSLMEPRNIMVYLFLTLILLLMYSSLLHFLNHVCNFSVILEQTTICFLIQVFSCLWPNVYNKYEYSGDYFPLSYA